MFEVSYRLVDGTITERMDACLDARNGQIIHKFLLSSVELDELGELTGRTDAYRGRGIECIT